MSKWLGAVLLCWSAAEVTRPTAAITADGHHKALLVGSLSHAVTVGYVGPGP